MARGPNSSSNLIQAVHVTQSILFVVIISTYDIRRGKAPAHKPRAGGSKGVWGVAYLA